ncbi:unnamed protein product [Rhizophagus irregularis]|nr:unnamed protein product [Rhizophagus irregularis]
MTETEDYLHFTSPAEIYGRRRLIYIKSWKSSITTRDYFQRIETLYHTERKLETIENEKTIELAEIERIKIIQTRNHVESAMKVHRKITDGIVTFSQEQNASSGCHTPERDITPGDDEEEESSLYDTFPTHIYKKPEPNSFLVSPQGKHDRDMEERMTNIMRIRRLLVGKVSNGS